MSVTFFLQWLQTKLWDPFLTRDPRSNLSVEDHTLLRIIMDSGVDPLGVRRGKSTCYPKTVEVMRLLVDDEIIKL